jgi:uncharacterized coiled-coil protein SlyX
MAHTDEDCGNRVNELEKQLATLEERLIADWDEYVSELEDEIGGLEARLATIKKKIDEFHIIRISNLPGGEQWKTLLIEIKKLTEV